MPSSFSLGVFLLVAAATSVTAVNTTFKTCNTGFSKMEILEFDKQPTECQKLYNTTLAAPCLMSVDFDVEDCNVTQGSNITVAANGFPCEVVEFTGQLTAPNALTMKSGIPTRYLAKAAAFCSSTEERQRECATLLSTSRGRAYVWRESDFVYIAATNTCTYKYKITLGSDFLNAPGGTPEGQSKTSKNVVASKGGAATLVVSWASFLLPLFVWGVHWM